MNDRPGVLTFLIFILCVGMFFIGAGLNDSSRDGELGRVCFRNGTCMSNLTCLKADGLDKAGICVKDVQSK